MKRGVATWLVMFLIAWLCTTALAEEKCKLTTEVKTVVEQIQRGDARGDLDWTKGTLTIRAQGFPSPRAKTDDQKKSTAREAATIIADRDFAKVIQGVRVTAEATVSRCALVDSEIRAPLRTFIKGGVPVKEEWTGESYLIEKCYPLYTESPLPKPAKTTLAGIFAPILTNPEKRAKIERKWKNPAQAIKAEDKRPPATPPKQVGPFTGLIVDCTGLEIKPCLSPKLLTLDGKEVWGTVGISLEMAISRGIVEYLPTIELAQQSDRAGSNPMIVLAIRKAGFFEADAVVSEEDALRIKQENEKTKFLDKLNVIFVIAR